MRVSCLLLKFFLQTSPRHSRDGQGFHKQQPGPEWNAARRSEGSDPAWLHLGNELSSASPSLPKTQRHRPTAAALGPAAPVPGGAASRSPDVQATPGAALAARVGREAHGPRDPTVCVCVWGGSRLPAHRGRGGSDSGSLRRAQIKAPLLPFSLPFSLVTFFFFFPSLSLPAK